MLALVSSGAKGAGLPTGAAGEEPATLQPRTMGKSAGECVQEGQEGTVVGGAGALPSRRQPNERSGCAERHTWPFTWLQ